MFRCSKCGTPRPAYESPVRRVVETRAKNYPFRKYAHRDGNDDPGGQGTEIVREEVLCSDCAG